MKKTLIYLFFAVSFLSFAESIDVAEKERFRKEERQEQERLQKSWKEKESFRREETQTGKEEAFPEERSFHISTIQVEDPKKLLDPLERNRILEKYQGKEMGSTAITKLLTELTNQLIAKGYVTTTATLADSNDVSSGVLVVKLLYGNIEKIVLNGNQPWDRLKTVFLIPAKEGDILNIRDLDTATENFNYLHSNHMSMEILPGEKPQHSILRLQNKEKERITLSFTTNNHGEEYQNGIWRYGSNLNIDSPLGIGDRLYISYQSVHRKNPDRSWKNTADTLNPGEILPIGPPGYDPSLGEVLPYKRILDIYHFKYTMKFKNYTLDIGSSKTKKESSFYAFNTIYDMSSSNQTLSAHLSNILWRNQTSKVSIGLGLQRKHHENYLERAILSDRILAVGELSLEGSTALWKGLASVKVGYERGLRALGAERDDGKIATTPKAQFHKYSFHANFYKPMTQKIDYRFRLLSSYTNDVLYGSEKQSIGGVGSVGGFHRTGGIQGDKAIEIEHEVAYKLWNSPKWGALSPYLSYSYGAVRNNANVSQYRKGHLSGMLLGLRYQMKYLDFDIAYAKPLHHSAYLTPKKREIYASISYKVKW